MNKIDLYEIMLSKDKSKYEAYLDKKNNIPIEKESILNHLKEKYKAKEVNIFYENKIEDIQTLNFQPIKKEHIYKILLIDDMEILNSLFICKEKENFLKIEYKDYKNEKLKEACYYDEDDKLDYDYEYYEDSEEKYLPWHCFGKYFEDWREKEDELNEIDIYNETEYRYGKYIEDDKVGVKAYDFKKVLNERLTRNGIWKDAVDIPDEYIENYKSYIILESLDGKYVTNINYLSKKCSKLEIYLKAIRNFSRIFSDNVEIKMIDGYEKLFFIDSDLKYIDITEDAKKDIDIFARSGFLGRELENNYNNPNKIKVDKNMYYDIYESDSIDLTDKELINMYEKDQKNSDKSLLFGSEDYIIEDKDISYDDLIDNPEINLSGYIEEVLKPDEMYTLVKIYSYNSKYSIHCYFEQDNYYYLASLDKGSLIVAMEGQLEREGNILGLYRCELLEIQLTVNELTNAYEEDFLFADKLYRRKKISINGEVESINIVHKRKVFLYLKTNSNNYIVECYFAFEEDFEYLCSLQKGDELKMSSGTLVRRENVLRVKDCVILKD
ncbi:MAG: hypothetical protein RSG52_07340 [Terrisporobacter sp.]|uniref:OB-fold protein n=1 Tax=Terrisporobacter sp. TaxID=1965305 RepID=UPI002FC90ABA